MAPRAGRGRFWATLAGAALITFGCTSPTPSASPATTRTPASGTPAASVSSSTTPSPTDPPFVAANVAVVLQPYAQVAGGALDIAGPNDGSGRLYVATQEGRIWWVTGSQTSPEPMLDISKRISTGGERGLLGIALHPRFPADPRIFVDYTDKDGNTVVSSFRLAAGESSRFDPASETVILQVEQPFPNHNGGGLAFDPGGFLSIGLGDGGSAGDPQGNGQSHGTLLAKLLRIDIDHPAVGLNYSTPSDNPFAGRSGGRGRPEIWLWGLRNPFRFSYDRATGDLWIGDVGQGRWEEVDVVRAGTSGGLNFGWNVMEGAHCFQPAEGCDQTGLALPVSEYGHDQGCAIIGGDVYRGTAYSLLRGAYLFTDSCTGTIWAIPAATAQPAQPVAVGESGGSPAGFGEDPTGELYLANLNGTISKITATSR